MKRSLFLLCLSLPIRVFAEGGLPDKPYIYVERKAEIQKPAEFVTLRFDLIARAPEQPKANQEVQSKANKIFASLKDRKIADNDVIAEDLRSEPEFEEGDDTPPNVANSLDTKLRAYFRSRFVTSLCFLSLRTT
jgi:uncharacterized protein YggE